MTSHPLPGARGIPTFGNKNGYYIYNQIMYEGEVSYDHFITNAAYTNTGADLAEQRAEYLKELDVARFYDINTTTLIAKQYYAHLARTCPQYLKTGKKINVLNLNYPHCIEYATNESISPRQLAYIHDVLLIGEAQNLMTPSERRMLQKFCEMFIEERAFRQGAALTSMYMDANGNIHYKFEKEVKHPKHQYVVDKYTSDLSIKCVMTYDWTNESNIYDYRVGPHEVRERMLESAREYIINGSNPETLRVWTSNTIVEDVTD